MIPDVEPMLAGSGLPAGDLGGWAVEPKFDGWRARVAIDGTTLLVRTRTGRTITDAVPELQALAVGGRHLLLDGELIAGAGTLADFYGLSGRLAGRRRTTGPVTFLAFDLLVLDEPMVDQPYLDRRRVLEALDLPALVVTPRFPGEDAPALLDACDQTGMEGVMVKKLDGHYLPGKRSDSWRKVKCAAWRDHARQRFR